MTAAPHNCFTDTTEATLRLMLASSCFGREVCPSLPCACAETLARLNDVAAEVPRCARCGSVGDTYVLCAGCGTPAPGTAVPVQAALRECASRCRYDGDLFHDQGNEMRRDASWKAAEMAAEALARCDGAAQGQPDCGITDELVDRALTENVDLIQGFTYETHHSIRDFRNEYVQGVEIWRCPAPSHGAFQKRLAHEKLKAQMIAAFKWASSMSSTGRTRPTVIGRVTGREYDGDQVAGMPGAICHACGLKDYPCANPDCPNKASSLPSTLRDSEAT